LVEKLGGKTEHPLKLRDVDGKEILKWDWKRRELDSSGSVQKKLAGSRQYEYELSIATKDREFLDYLINSWFLNEGSAI
jgi:hypothetical protein